RRERGEAAVPAQKRPRHEEPVPDSLRNPAATCLRAVGCDADADRLASGTVAYEHVQRVVRVVLDEVVRPRAEAHEAAVLAEDAAESRAVSLLARRRDIDALGDALDPVPDEDVRMVI